MHISHNLTNTPAPFAKQQIHQELKESRFLSVFIDSSNYLGSTNLGPILVMHYRPEKGMMVKVLELNLIREPSGQVLSYVLDVLKTSELREKPIDTSADNMT